MRRKRKVQWFVQDWGDFPHLWWSGGKWVRDYGNHGASSMKFCRNQSNAMRNARRIKSLGGDPLISSRSKRKGWRDWRLNG